MSTAKIIEFDPNRRSLKKQPYEFVPEFQYLLATALCKRPALFGRIGKAVDPECISDATACLAIKAAQEIERTTGRGPANLLFVMQWLRSKVHAGTSTFEELRDLGAMFDNVEDVIGDKMSDDEICSLVVPVLRQRMQFDAATRIVSSLSKPDGLKPVYQAFESSFHLGEVDTSPGVVCDATSLNSILQNIKRETVPFGIMPLDDIIGGGPAVGTQALFIGSTGAGKSMTLSHIAGTFAMFGKRVAYATLELAEHIVLSRLLSSVTAVPIDRILKTGADVKLESRLEDLKTKGYVPPFVKSFEPRNTTPKNLIDWTEDLKSRTGNRIDCLVVDYIDKLTIPSHLTDRNMNDYKMAEIITEGLRVWAESNAAWNITASQAKRRELKKQSKAWATERLGLNDVCDSLHKVKVPDYVITINGRETIYWFVAKNRHGEADISVGPTNVQFEIARVAPRIDPW